MEAARAIMAGRAKADGYDSAEAMSAPTGCSSMRLFALACVGMLALERLCARCGRFREGASLLCVQMCRFGDQLDQLALGIRSGGSRVQRCRFGCYAMCQHEKRPGNRFPASGFLLAEKQGFEPWMPLWGILT